jgi:hypothetical protein
MTHYSLLLTLIIHTGNPPRSGNLTEPELLAAFQAYCARSNLDPINEAKTYGVVKVLFHHSICPHTTLA